MELFQLNPLYFPEATRDALALETILRFGVLPLGTKHGYRRLVLRCELLNVGVVDRRLEKAAIAELRREARKRQAGIGDVQLYEIHPSRFLEVLERCYGLTPHQLSGKAPGEVHPALLEAARRSAPTPPSSPGNP